MSDSIFFLLMAFCALYWAVSVGFLVISAAATILQPRLAARRGTRADQPPVSLVLPVKLLEQGFARAQGSALDQLYPRFEAIASAVETNSPAVETMRELFARRPHIPSRILRSSARFAASPKVDNLFAPFREAEHDVIFMKDSNVVLEKDDLAQCVRHLTDDVGLVCAIPYAAKPENFAAHVETGVMNGPHQRSLFAASAFLGQGFGVGKIMLFRRSDFLRAGGFAAIAHTVGEDNAMAEAMKRIGLRTVFSHRPVRQELGSRTLRDVYDRQLRWYVIRRNDVLLSFLAEPICQALPAFAAAAVAAPLVGLEPLFAVGATFTLWLTLETLLSFAKGWQVSWAAPAIFLAREALMLAVWLQAWTATRVVWAKETLDTRAASGAIEDGAPPAAKEEG